MSKMQCSFCISSSGYLSLSVFLFIQPFFSNQREKKADLRMKAKKEEMRTNKRNEREIDRYI